MKIVDRFIKYVKVDTMSDPNSTTSPSALKELDLSKILYQELLDLNLTSVILDEYGYLYGYLKGNTDTKKSIGFIAHVDTATELTGKNVSPRIIKNYDGLDILLNNKYSITLNEFPGMSKYTGHDLIVTDGNTLLGADDKAGIAIIMNMLDDILENNLPHGDIYVAFTPDEEIGQGTKHFNLDNFKADFAYTLDGDEVGCVEYENFNASHARVSFNGKSIHPGSAKNKMINASLLAMEFNGMLPIEKKPSFTEGYEGFNHLTDINGTVDNCQMEYIIRNHDKKLFKEQEKSFEIIKDYINLKYGYEACSLEITQSYKNMAECFIGHMDIIDIAYKAIEMTKINPFSKPIRGGTDGASLTYMGLLTPNLGTGCGNFHGRYEFASINDMLKAKEILLNIIKLLLQ